MPSMKCDQCQKIWGVATANVALDIHGTLPDKWSCPKCEEESCPECKGPLEWEEVDIGVGIRRGPAWCDNIDCGWEEDWGLLGGQRHMIKSLEEIQPVRLYLQRIGAEGRGLRTAVVRELKGSYWDDKAVIRFDEKGAVRAPDSYLPTLGEQKKIQAAWGAMEFPALRRLPRRWRHNLPNDMVWAVGEGQYLRLPRAGRGAPLPPPAPLATKGGEGLHHLDMVERRRVAPGRA